MFTITGRNNGLSIYYMTIGQFKTFVSSSEEFSLENGIWYASSPSIISYPEDGHNDYFDIEEDSFWFRHRNNCIISVIKKYTPDHVFFDIGGGNGFVTKAIEGAQISSVLIEPGKQAVINAKKRNLENIFCGTLTDLNGMAGQLTSIGAFDVIEHISADDTFIQEIYKMLKSGGYFFVTVPALQFLWSYEDAIAGHFKRYSRKRIVKLLRDHNFDVIYSSYYFSILLLPLFFIRVVPFILGIRKNSKIKIHNEHKQRKGFIGKILDSIWNWELGRIQQQKSIPFGTSCLIVAMKR